MIGIIAAGLLLAGSGVTVWQWEHHKRATFEANKTIISGSQVRKLFHSGAIVQPENITGYWTPSTADITEVEAALPTLFIRGEYPLQPLPTPLERYYRQYGGILRNGRKMIFVNGFVSPGKVRWQVEVVPPLSHDKPFFTTIYDMENFKFIDTMFSEWIGKMG